MVQVQIREIVLIWRFSLAVEKLIAYSNHAQGYTPDFGSVASPDQSKWDITIDYRPELPTLKGLWLRFRRAEVDQDGGGAVDYRFILNWKISIL